MVARAVVTIGGCNRKERFESYFGWAVTNAVRKKQLEVAAAAAPGTD